MATAEAQFAILSKIITTKEADVRLYLIRHGQTEYNKQRMIQGHTEVPLNATGIAQAKLMARRMAGVSLDRIYASDLRRTEMTATILSGETGVPVQYEPLFRERHPGQLTNGTYEDAEPFFTDLDYEPPGGESVPVFMDRVKAAFDTLLAIEGGTSNNVAVVSHGMVCAAFVRGCLGMTQEKVAATSWPNTALTIADYENEWRLVTLTDASHLDGMEEGVSHSTGA